VNVGPAIVTALRSNGFYMQDVTPDADDATSEGIFVFTSSAPTVAVGTRVNVQGTVAEFRPGCSPSCAASDSAYDNLTITELTSPSVSVINTGNALPAPVVLGQGAGKRAVPLQVICDDSSSSVEADGAFDPQNDGIDFYESLEAMRVQIDSPQVIDPTRTFTGNSLEIGVLARTDASLRTARSGILATESDFNPERVFLSNAIVSSFPNVNVADAFSGAVIGVMDYTFANYKLMVTQALPSVTSGGLVRETTALQANAATQLSIASMNVENLDALDAASKFNELAQIVVNNLRSPDLVALEEVQDNNGATNNGVVDAATTLNTLISAIASAGGPSYVYRQIDPVNNADGGEPGGNIRVAFLFRTDRGLAFVDRAGGTSTTANSIDTSGPQPHLAFSPGRIDPGNTAFNSSRKPLAGEFTFRGRTLFVIANHFNSKGGDDPLFGRFQPPVLSSEAQRLQQATILASFVDAIFTADSEAFVVALGDFNDFSFSAPLEKLLDVGLIDLIHTLPANERYTYVYQGNSQDLDHN
jgi:predicted extracellular nuclease